MIDGELVAITEATNPLASSCPDLDSARVELGATMNIRPDPLVCYSGSAPPSRAVRQVLQIWSLTTGGENQFLHFVRRLGLAKRLRARLLNFPAL